MKIVQITLLAGVALLWTGCSSTEPSVSSASTEHVVTLDNGKQYSVPVGTIYTQSPVTKKVIQRYTELGVKDCKNGDITWETKNLADNINEVMRNGSKDEGLVLYKEAAKVGTVGCASPITSK